MAQRTRAVRECESQTQDLLAVTQPRLRDQESSEDMNIRPRPSGSQATTHYQNSSFAADSPQRGVRGLIH